MSVYFAAAGPYVKIGFSTNPASRMSTVTRLGTRPADLPSCAQVRPLGWIPGGRDRETELHIRFTAHRVGGEWFSLDLIEVRDLIWSDPRGIDLDRMSAQAVFAAIKHPELTRDDLVAAGVCIEGVPEAKALGSMFAAPLKQAAS